MMPPLARLKNPLEWLRQLWYMELKIHRPFGFDVIVLELGTDKPGDIRHFRKYLRPAFLPSSRSQNRFSFLYLH